MKRKNVCFALSLLFWASLAYSQVTLPGPRTLWRTRKSSYRSGKSSGNEVAGHSGQREPSQPALET